MSAFLSARVLIPLALAIVLSGGGWMARGWYEDAQRLTAREAAEQAIHAAQARESTIAEQVESRLAHLKTTERVIDRGVIREIQKPVYRRVCIEPDGLRLLNAAAAGLATDPAELDAALSADTAAPG